VVYACAGEQMPLAAKLLGLDGPTTTARVETEKTVPQAIERNVRRIYASPGCAERSTGRVKALYPFWVFRRNDRTIAMTLGRRSATSGSIERFAARQPHP
jgi:hypothetical protein